MSMPLRYAFDRGCKICVAMARAEWRLSLECVRMCLHWRARWQNVDGAQEDKVW